MTRLQKIALVVIAFMVAVTATILHALPAAALTTPPSPAGSTGFGQWNWPAIVQTNSATGNKGGGCSGSCSPLPVADFDPETSSYVIYHAQGGDYLTPYNPFGSKTVARTTWLLAIANPGRTLVLKKDLSTGDYVIVSDQSNFRTVNIADFNGENANPSGSFWGSVTGGSASSSSAGNIEYILVARNVTYSGTWDAGVFNSTPNYGSGTVSCDTLDVACHVAKMWSNVTNTIASVGRAIVDTFVRFFIPTGTEIADRFDEFNDFLVAKLGFLTYPFTFLVDLFDAFTASSSFTCTESACVKSFGTFLTGTFTLDFALMAQEFPTLWNWLKAMIIGLTILELIIMIRRKAMGVIHK